MMSAAARIEIILHLYGYGSISHLGYGQLRRNARLEFCATASRIFVRFRQAIGKRPFDAVWQQLFGNEFAREVCGLLRR